MIFKCASGELVKAKLFELSVLSPYLRGLFDDSDKDTGCVIDATDFHAADVQSIVDLLHSFDQVAVHTCINKVTISNVDPTVAELPEETEQKSTNFNLNFIEWPNALIRFVHKYEINMVLELCKWSINKDPDPDIGEIIAYDAISPDDASWAGPDVVNLLVKQQVAEHHGLDTEG